MKFRPCIDIHNGKVKQLVGASIQDKMDEAVENFVSEYDAAYYAEFYKQKKVKHGHVIILNAKESPYYELSKMQALEAIRSYPKGLQLGGGVTPDNAEEYLNAGASHVIVTSYVFNDGSVNYENLKRIKSVTGKKHLVLDLSCRKKEDGYYIMTDRWQKYTNVRLTDETLDELSDYCDEFLVHAVDVEGKLSGIECPLVELLGDWNKIHITYAGGVSSYLELENIRELGVGKIDVTIGSALDLFGGNLKFEDVLRFMNSTTK